MAAFHIHKKKKNSSPLFLLLVPVGLLVLITVFAGGVLLWYQQNLRPLSTNTNPVVVTVSIGTTAPEIGDLLQGSEVIRSGYAFDWYVRLGGYRDKLQAGSYKFSPSESVETIVGRLTEGDVARDLVTILPAQRLDQVKMAFAQAGYTSEEINTALDPKLYDNHPVLAGKPATASLEGYLYPESYQRSLDTNLSDIVKTALDEMENHISAELLTEYTKLGLTKFQAITLSSIVEREVNNSEDRAKVAQVFLKRYSEGIQLGSDPTALYGALLAGMEPSVSTDTPYNTRLYVGLPPGPINNVSIDSLEAVAYPATTDFLFFVSGDDGITYFSRTLQEHEALTSQHCIELCRSY